MAQILPRDLTSIPGGTINPAAAIIVDNGDGVFKGTPANVVDSGAPVNSQGEAEAGAVNTGRMTPLRVKQAIDALGVSQDVLASSTGGAMVGLDDGLTSQGLFTIMKATRRPAMDGIFSSGSDQLAALKAFVADSAANGKVIEWGPIDLSYDAVTPDNSVRGLGVPSNSRWVFHPETRLRALPTDSGDYTILNIRDQSNIVIEGAGAQIIGERDEHTGGTGESGIGVAIRGANDIVIRDLHVSDCWGDGWYIGSTSNQAWCERVYLQNISATNVRRNGLSLISAKGFRCIDGRFIDTSGTLPEYGIDIEPNFTTDFLEDIEFIRCFTQNNESFGIGVNLNLMEGSSNPVGIRIIDHVDDGSASAVYAFKAIDIDGLVEVINLKSINSVGPGVIMRGKGASGPLWKFVNPVIKDWNRQASSTSTFGSAFLCYAANGDSGTYALGKVDIINPDISLTNGADTVTNAICIIDQRTTTPDPAQDVQIMDPINLQGLPCFAQGVKLFSDRYRKSVTTRADASATLGVSGFYVHNILPANAGSRNLDIANTQPIGLEMVFELAGTNSGQWRLGLPAGVNFSPDAITNDTGYLYATVKGSRIRVRKVSSTEWFETEKIGTWTAT